MQKKTRQDPTMSPESLFGSRKWVAQRLGMTVDKFSSKHERLKVGGFPNQDPIVGSWIKADVDAWVTKRRRIGDPKTSAVKDKGMEDFNFDGF